MNRNYLAQLRSLNLTRGETSAKEDMKANSARRAISLSGIRKDGSMFRSLLCLGVILGTLVPGRSANAQRPFPTRLIPTRTALERVGLERHWFGVIPLVETERLLKISLGGDLLFAQTSYAMLHTYDAETGRPLWSAQLGERTGFARGVASNSFAVFVSNADKFYALDKSTGRLIWRHDLGRIPTSSPACDENRAMLGLKTGKIYAFELKVKDEKGKESILTKPLEAWNWQTGGPMLTRPLPAENVVAFGSNDGKAYVVMAYERTPLFRIATGGPIGQGLGGYGTRTLLIPSADNNLYGVDLFTAKVNWTFASGAPIEQEPLVSDQDIYVINTAGNLSLLDPATGEPRWTTSTQGGQLVAVAASKVYLRSYNLDLFLIDRKSGATLVDPGETLLRAGLNLRDYDLNIVNRYNDRMYFATPSGMVICLRETGQAQPRPLKDPKALPFGYVPPEGIKLTPPAPPGAEPKIELGIPGREAQPAADKDKEKSDADGKEKEPAEKDKDADKPKEPPAAGKGGEKEAP
jgi:outer membrane protein assembly factor BamB